MAICWLIPLQIFVCSPHFSASETVLFYIANLLSVMTRFVDHDNFCGIQNTWPHIQFLYEIWTKILRHFWFALGNTCCLCRDDWWVAPIMTRGVLQGSIFDPLLWINTLSGVISLPERIVLYDLHIQSPQNWKQCLVEFMAYLMNPISLCCCQFD